MYFPLPRCLCFFLIPAFWLTRSSMQQLGSRTANGSLLPQPDENERPKHPDVLPPTANHPAGNRRNQTVDDDACTVHKGRFNPQSLLYFHQQAGTFVAVKSTKKQPVSGDLAPIRSMRALDHSYVANGSAI